MISLSEKSRNNFDAATLYCSSASLITSTSVFFILSSKGMSSPNFSCNLARASTTTQLKGGLSFFSSPRSEKKISSFPTSPTLSIIEYLVKSSAFSYSFAIKLIASSLPILPSASKIVGWNNSFSLYFSIIKSIAFSLLIFPSASMQAKITLSF